MIKKLGVFMPILAVSELKACVCDHSLVGTRVCVFRVLCLCHVEVSLTDWSIVKIIPTECVDFEGLCLCLFVSLSVIKRNLNLYT